ncbi:potassium channel family protein [Roseococcus thiosulfatophilus]|uniref:potassium channel family protein n=1 Tax=Roseococcus thiosulfatophilus TaxID=35813 RepID=UPI001A906D05|nr:potassium channel family protein [Roseococcus thiosulfatophilus]
MAPERPSLRRRLFVQLSPRQWPAEGMSPANKAIGALILFSVAVATLESEITIYEGNEAIFSWLEIILGGIFLGEYLTRIWVAPEADPDGPAWRARLRFITSPAGILDLLALSPLLLEDMGPQAFLLRLARMLRILRFARLGQFSGAFAFLKEAIASRRHELFLGLCVASGLLVLSATLLYVVEGDAQPEAFGSIPRSMWWAIATLTTVGYGDVAPITWLGRVCAGFIAALGIGLIAIPTGILAAAFSDAAEQQRIRKEAARKAHAHRHGEPH